MKRIVLAASIALLGSACTTTQVAESVKATAATPTGAAAAINAAEAARSKAAAVGAEWRDTAQLIEDAKKAEAAKDPATATELARQALHQSENALRQHAEQMNAGN